MFGYFVNLRVDVGMFYDVSLSFGGLLVRLKACWIPILVRCAFWGTAKVWFRSPLYNM